MKLDKEHHQTYIYIYTYIHTYTWFYTYISQTAFCLRCTTHREIPQTIPCLLHMCSRPTGDRSMLNWFLEFAEALLGEAWIAEFLRFLVRIFPFSVLFGSSRRGYQPTGRRVNHGKTLPDVKRKWCCISGGQVLCFLDGISLALLEICSTWWRRLVAWRNHLGDTCVFFHLPFGWFVFVISGAKPQTKNKQKR